MAGGAFDKDFGYLMPFLDKVAAAADALPDRAARDELTRLVAGEKLRWERIRSLLSGAAGAATASGERPAPGSPPAAASTAEPAGEDPAASPPFSFTVGSLRPRGR
jgi:hypothetical protein